MDSEDLEVLEEGSDSVTRTGNMHKDSCGY